MATFNPIVLGQSDSSKYCPPLSRPARQVNWHRLFLRRSICESLLSIDEAIKLTLDWGSRLQILSMGPLNRAFHMHGGFDGGETLQLLLRQPCLTLRHLRRSRMWATGAQGLGRGKWQIQGFAPPFSERFILWQRTHRSSTRDRIDQFQRQSPSCAWRQFSTANTFSLGSFVGKSTHHRFDLSLHSHQPAGRTVITLHDSLGHLGRSSTVRITQHGLANACSIDYSTWLGNAHVSSSSSGAPSGGNTWDGRVVVAAGRRHVRPLI